MIRIRSAELKREAGEGLPSNGTIFPLGSPDV